MLRDTLNRPVKDLRISVTDRCNFRCTYCMPFDEYEWIEKKEILSFEEIERLARLFIPLGVDKIRLTGGEPALTGLRDLCLTTNASHLAEMAAPLKAAGLTRINVSLDTLDAEKFKRMTGRGDLAAVLEGLSVAQRIGLLPIKINAVIERGVNDNEILDLVEFSRQNGFAIRFIEYMDVGNANQWQSGRMVSKKEILEVIQTRYSLRLTGRDQESAPSVDFELTDGSGDIGVIASVTEPFCFGCTRARLTADGKLVTCLFSNDGHDLKTLMRSAATDEDLLEVILAIWTRRADRYSEERLEAMHSRKGYEPRAHKKIEMIRLGG